MSERARPAGWADAALYERLLRRLEWPMLILSVIYLAVLTIGLIDLPEAARRPLGVLETAVTVAFAVELAALMWTAPDKRRAAKAHWLDVLIVAAPFLRPLRLGRLLRVARAGSTFGRTLAGLNAITSRRGVRGTFAFAAATTVTLGLLTWAIEHPVDGATILTPADGLWWAVVTSTTVGYGDLAPVTGAGRAVATALMLLGVALIGTITASVAAYFVERDTHIRTTPSGGEDAPHELPVAELEAAQALLENNALPANPHTLAAAAQLLAVTADGEEP